MPCSALIEPPAAVTRSWTSRETAAPSRSEPVGPSARSRTDMEMDVAVAEMAEARSARSRKCPFNLGRGFRHEQRHVLDRHADVMLGRRAEGGGVLPPTGCRVSARRLRPALRSRKWWHSRSTPDQPGGEQPCQQFCGGSESAVLAVASTRACHSWLLCKGARVPEYGR